MTALYVILMVLFLILFIGYFVFLDKANRAGQDVCIIAMFLLACSTLIFILK